MGVKRRTGRTSSSAVSVLFSEPKIPQSKDYVVLSGLYGEFQCSSASRKFLNPATRAASPVRPAVSVLFSEPKIPQYPNLKILRALSASFSALQRAENSSIAGMRSDARGAISFQCSSASRKFLNSGRPPTTSACVRFGFSALQRAENSSIVANARRCAVAQREVSVLFSEPKIPQFNTTAGGCVDPPLFQCSSASRKFLNSAARTTSPLPPRKFQCSSASRKFLNPPGTGESAARTARFQCSSASRKFLNAAIVQQALTAQMFQCSSASRKFLNKYRYLAQIAPELFQCSSASRKFLNRQLDPRCRQPARCFSALQRAENSSILV